MGKRGIVSLYFTINYSIYLLNSLQQICREQPMAALGGVVIHDLT